MHVPVSRSVWQLTPPLVKMSRCWQLHVPTRLAAANTTTAPMARIPSAARSPGPGSGESSCEATAAAAAQGAYASAKVA